MAFTVFDPQLSWWTEDLYPKPQIVELPPSPIPESPQRELRPEYQDEATVTEIRGNDVEIWLTPDAMEATVAPPNLPQLPIEVWERIIDNSHRRNLVACALTCRAWFSRCRYWLYQDLHVRSEGGLDAVLETLSSAPDLAKYVHSLTVYGGEYYNLALITHALLHLGPKLTELSRLYIHSLDLTHGHIHRFFRIAFLVYVPPGTISV